MIFDSSDTPKSNPICEFLFTGRRFDTESELYFYRARYYNPQLGRFISRDPIGYRADSLGLYEYAGGAPVDFVDPMGTDYYEAGCVTREKCVDNKWKCQCRIRVYYWEWVFRIFGSGNEYRGIVFRKDFYYKGKCNETNKTSCRRLKDVFQNVYDGNEKDRVKLRNLSTAITVMRIIPGGEAAHQIDEGNYGRAVLAVTIDVVGMGAGAAVSGTVKASTGVKIAAGVGTNAVIRGVGHGTTRAVAD